MDKLIELTKNKLESYKIEECRKNGLRKRRFMKGTSSQLVVTYPPLSILPTINSNDIFKESNSKGFTLYFHIPFCTGRCLYCGFATYANQSKQRVDEYLNALKKEVRLYLKFPQVKKAKVKSVYIGGGTPTYLITKQLNDLLEFINKNFNIERGAEFTIEASPETLTKEKLKCLLDNGVNRLSIGVQTFDNDILKLILRRHDSRKAISAFKLAREVGFDNINIDLIRGLPDLTPEKLLNDLKILEELKPESISGYHLIVKPTAAIQKLFREEPERFPDERTSLLMHLMIMKKLIKSGYKHYPIDWFYLESKSYKQQLQKWEEIINQLSFGISAYGYVNNVQYYNERDINRYLELINGAELPIKGGLRLSRNEQIHRKFVFGLKTKVDKKLFEKEFGKIPEHIRKKMDEYKKAGLIDEDENVIRLTEKGALFADEICIKLYSDEVAKNL